MAEKRRTVLIALLVLNLVFSGAVLALKIAEKCGGTFSQDKYILYVGTNDKDTDAREIPFEECQNRVEKVCLEYVPGLPLRKVTVCGPTTRGIS